MRLREIEQLHPGDEVIFKKEIIRIVEIEIVKQSSLPPVVVRIRRHDGVVIEATPRELS